jgi:PEP-CTERM motif
MPLKTTKAKAMKVLSIALITFASTISLWAQGQFVEGSGIEASRITSECAITFSPLPPTPLTDSSGVEMIEAFRPTTGISQFPSPLPPTPDLQIQFDQAGIQPAPEPSTFALGSLALGLIALARLSKRQQVLKR